MSEDIVIRFADNGDNQWVNIFPELLNYINDNFLRGYHPVLKSTCQKWNEHLAQQKNESLAIYELAERGYLTLLRFIIDFKWHLLAFGISGSTNTFQPVLYEMLNGGASGGNLEICNYAKSQGADNFGSMLIEAASMGHESVCRLAKEWIDSGCSIPAVPAVRQDAVALGTRCSGININILNDALFSAALYGHQHIPWLPEQSRSGLSL